VVPNFVIILQRFQLHLHITMAERLTRMSRVREFKSQTGHILHRVANGSPPL